MFTLRGTEGPVDVRGYATELADALMRRLAAHSVDGSVHLPPADELARDIVDLYMLPVEHHDNALAAELGPFWSAPHTATVLGLAGEEELDERRRAGRVLGRATSDGQWVYPVLQFYRDAGTVRVRQRLVEFLRPLRGHDGWAVGLLLTTSAPELDGLSPLDWVKEQQNMQRLSRYARRVAAELP